MTPSARFSPKRPLRIGTRASPLAMAQAQMVAAAICAYHTLPSEAVMLVPMLASGDKITDRPLADIGGKALWTKELDRALTDGDVDIAVHSMKDVETLRPARYRLAAMLPRADVRDRLVGAGSLADLKKAAHVGTSSPRRTAQLLWYRPDLIISPIRGNVATRLAQIDRGIYDASLLAAAGLDRLSLPETGAAVDVGQMLPAAAQGAIGAECLSSRPDIIDSLAAINHAETYECVMAERAFLAALGGGCHSPVAALALRDGDKIWLRGEILREDGREKQASALRFKPGDHEAPGRLAAQLLERASEDLRALFGA